MTTEPTDGQAPAADDLDDLHIETAGYVEPDLEERPDPRRNRDLATLACGRPGGPPRVFIHETALREALDHAREDSRNEVGGVLLGDLYRSRGRLVTEVHRVVLAPATRAGVSHVTFSHETWEEINRRTDTDHPDERIVGWYHSHPGIGVFMSHQDTFIQEHFFNGHGQLALVVDPVKDEVLLYATVDSQVLACGGFWLTAGREDRGRAQACADALTYKGPQRPSAARRLLGRVLRRKD